MEAPMLHGDSKSFMVGSSCFTRDLKSPIYNDQRVTIVKYVSDKQRWAVKLFAEQFQGKEPILVSEKNLHFDHFAARSPVPLPEYLRLRETPCGEALYSLKDFEKGQVVFEDHPMMVVHNGNLAFDSRWNLYFGTEHERGENSPILKAFNGLSEGGQTEEYVGDAGILFDKILKKSMGDAQAAAFSKSPDGKKFIQGETTRIAGVLARWQTNSHAFPLRGSDVGPDEISALFRFGSKMQHSCEPNCLCTVDPREGVMSVRALRPIKAGDLVTNSYMGIQQEWMSKSLKERRADLTTRGFHCCCDRCMREEKMGDKEPVGLGGQ